MSRDQCIIIQNLIYQPIFNEINLILDNRKTGLVGRNGIGKSTLLRLIANELQPTSGVINTFGKISYCPQDFSSYAAFNVAEFFNAAAKLRALDNILQGSTNDSDFTCLADDWMVKERLLQCLAKFSLSMKLSAKIGELSNGEITRLWLAKIFNFEPRADFIMLDEPTNNLDVAARGVLYQEIQDWPYGMLIISHDQQLLEHMDQIVTLTEHGACIYGGNFNFYQEQLKLERAAKERHFEDAKKTLTKALTTIQISHEKHEQRQSYARRAKQKNDQPKAMLDFAKNRSGRTQETLSKQAARLMAVAEEKLQAAKDNLEIDYNIEVALPQTFVPRDKIIMVFDNVSFRYAVNQPFILRNFNLVVRGPERLAICGNNGSGKTTCVKLMRKVLMPEIGAILTKVHPYYLDQKLEILDPQLSIIDNYRNLNPAVGMNEAHRNLASFLFRGDAALRKVAFLSCGEKMRAALACILLAEKPPELLVLDEPTNHLDLESLACLVSILKNYAGALIVISHDQKFLENLAVTRVINAATDFFGSAAI